MLNNERFSLLLQNHGTKIAFIIALVATLGSLYYSEIRHFIPCTLCWYQRILMYPLVLIMIVGLIEGDDMLPVYVIPFALLGILLSGYHYSIQLGVMGSSTSCAVGVPCSARYVNFFGFVTIPFMALTSFSLILVTMLATKRAQGRAALAAVEGG